jgi:hypothetical protein
MARQTVARLHGAWTRRGSVGAGALGLARTSRQFGRLGRDGCRRGRAAWLVDVGAGSASREVASVGRRCARGAARRAAARPLARGDATGRRSDLTGRAARHRAAQGRLARSAAARQGPHAAWERCEG